MPKDATPVNPSQRNDSCDDVNRVQTGHAVVDAKEVSNVRTKRFRIGMMLVEDRSSAMMLTVLTFGVLTTFGVFAFFVALLTLVTASLAAFFLVGTFSLVL